MKTFSALAKIILPRESQKKKSDAALWESSDGLGPKRGEETLKNIRSRARKEGFGIVYDICFYAEGKTFYQEKRVHETGIVLYTEKIVSEWKSVNRVPSPQKANFRAFLIF